MLESSRTTKQMARENITANHSITRGSSKITLCKEWGKYKNKIQFLLGEL